MKIFLPLKPISINDAFQGRRFKTREAKQFERAAILMLPKARVEGQYYSIAYRFYLKNFALTDADNLVKVLQDCLVKKGIITDDRRIVEYWIKKFPAQTDRIEIEVRPTPIESCLNLEAELEAARKEIAAWRDVGVEVKDVIQGGATMQDVLLAMTRAEGGRP